MRRYIRTFCLLWLIFSVFSCASLPVAPPEWGYEKETIHVHLKAEPLLNLYDGVPHPLQICVYQLKDSNALVRLSEDDEGLYKLIECGRFDSSVVSHKSLNIQPGQDLIFDLDRAKDAKYVAVVAGYYLLQKEAMVRLFEVPVIIEKKGWIKRTRIAKPAPLSIELTLGPQKVLFDCTEISRPYFTE